MDVLETIRVLKLVKCRLNVRGKRKPMSDVDQFAAFKVLWNAVPMSEQSAELICSCLNYYVGKSGKSIRELEKILAQYKLEKATTK